MDLSVKTFSCSRVIKLFLLTELIVLIALISQSSDCFNAQLLSLSLMSLTQFNRPCHFRAMTLTGCVMQGKYIPPGLCSFLCSTESTKQLSYTHTLPKSKQTNIAVVIHPCYMGSTEFPVQIYCLANANSWGTFHESTLKNLSAHGAHFMRVHSKT